MKKLTTLLLCSALIALTGCVMVPKTQITGTIDGQPFTLSSPKDSKLEGLEITSQSGGLTNYVTIKIQSVEARMNPEVIQTTADGQVKLVRAVGAEIRAAGEKVATGAGK